MVHCQMPLLSLLCLLGALLLLPLQLTLGRPEKFCQVTLKDEGLQKAMAFTVPQFNLNRIDDANYYKLQRVIARSKAYTGTKKHIKYRIKIEVVKTSCKKTISNTLTYQEIQRCTELPGNPQKESCYLKVTSLPVQDKMTMKIVSCA